MTSAIRLTIEAPDMGIMMEQLRAWSAGVVHEAAQEQARRPRRAAPAAQDGLAAYSEQALIDELQKRLASRGFRIEVTEAAGKIEDARQADALADMSGQDEGSAAAPEQDNPAGPLPPAEDKPAAARDDEAKKVRQEAVKLLTQVYARGAEGKKKVAEIRAKMGVDRMVEVPLSRAHELLALAKEADAATAKAKAA